MSAATGQSLVVGVEAMDEQRGILMDTLNELRQKLADGSNRANLHRQMSWLVEFAEMHFDCEEMLLLRYGYPELDEHCDAHRGFLVRIESLVDEPEVVEVRGLDQTLGLLQTEFVDHVEKQDRRYGEWLNALGIY
jgi:hemerythrin